MDKKALIETAKEALRLAYFAALAAVVTYLQATLGGMDPNSAMVIGGGLLLKLADKYVNKSQKIQTNGLAPSVLQR